MTIGFSDACAIIELAMIKFQFSREDQITSVSGEFSSFNDPSAGIPEEITDLTGISPSDVFGASLDIDAIEDFLSDVSLVIAHNAYFDRPITERYIPSLKDLAWACSASEIPGKAEGLPGARLGYLLTEYGLFYDAHRALDDCRAVLALLTRSLPKSGDGGFASGEGHVASTRHAHEKSTVWLLLSHLLDLAGDRLDALVEPEPIFVEANDQVGHARGNLVFAVLQDLEQRVAQRPRAGANGDALFDEEGPGSRRRMWAASSAGLSTGRSRRSGCCIGGRTC